MIIPIRAISSGNTGSTTGGSGAIPQFDSNGDIHFSPVANNNAILDLGGNLFVSDKRGIKFTNQAGVVVGSLYSWGDHQISPLQNELILQSTGRIAIIAYEGMQTAPNDAARYMRYMEFNSGYAAATPADSTRMPSEAIILQTKAWSGSASVSNDIILQAKALDGSGVNSILKIYDQASLVTGLTGDPTATKGDATGNLIAEIYKDGIAEPGKAPAPLTLTAVSNVFTQVCSKYKSVQFAKLTLGAVNTLALSGLVAGMRGVLVVTHTSAGHGLTMPSGSCLPSDWALSATAGKIDKMFWDFDGTYITWTIKAGLDQPIDPDANNFLVNSSNNGDSTIRSAINNLSISLKASGTSPNTLWELTKRCWPFVGSTATKHNFELKSGASLGAFSATGLTHNASGITGDGATGFMRTGFVPSASASQNSIGIFVYNRTLLPTDNGTFICGYGAGGVQVGIQRAGASLKKLGLNTTDTTQIRDQLSNFQGLLFAVRSGASTEAWGKVGGLEQTGTITSTSNCDTQIALLGRFDGGATYDYPSNANIALAMITEALDSTQRAALKVIVDNFQTDMNRVYV